MGSEPNTRPDVWATASTWDRVGLIVIKLFDLVLHMYMLGLLSYTIFLNALVLLSEVSDTEDIIIGLTQVFLCSTRCGCLYSDLFRAKYV